MTLIMQCWVILISNTIQQVCIIGEEQCNVISVLCSLMYGQIRAKVWKQR